MINYINTVQLNNAVVQGATVKVTSYPNNGAVTIYSDNGMTVIPNSTVTSASNGQINFYAPEGRYNLLVTYGGYSYTEVDVDLAAFQLGLTTGAVLIGTSDGYGNVQASLNSKAPLSAISAANLANVAALAAATTGTLVANTVQLTGYYSPAIDSTPDGGGGPFVYDATDTTSGAVFTGSIAPNTLVPTAPSPGQVGSGGAINTGTYYVKVTYVSAVGETTASPETSIAVGSNSSIITVPSPSAQPGATGYKVYISTTSGAEQLQTASAVAIGTTADILVYLTGQPTPPSSSTFGGLLTVTATTSGAVAINQRLFNNGVASGTYVTGGSGSTWTVNISQTLASGTFTASDGGSYVVDLSGRRFKRQFIGPIVDKWFGLQGSLTDNRMQLQAAINAAAAIGSSVQLTPSTSPYVVSSSGIPVPGSTGNYCLLLPSGMTLFATDPNAAIQSNTDAVTIIASAGASSSAHNTDVHVRGIKLIGGDSTNNGIGRGIFLFRCDRSSVEFCNISKTRLGIQVDRISTDAAYNVGIDVTNNVVHDTFGTTTGNGSGIFVSGTDGFKVSMNQCLAIAEHGIYLSQNIKNGEIIGNNLQPITNDNQNVGVQVYTAVATPDISNLVIAGNTTSNGKWGYLVSAAGGGKATQITVTGNKASNFTTNGIVLSNVNEASITANVVTGTTAGNGIEVDASRSVTVNGNTSSGNFDSGIIFVTTTDSIICGNISINNDTGLNGNYGIRVTNGATGNKIIGNICTDYQGTKTQAYGIAISTADCYSTEIIGNTTSGNRLGDILDAVSGFPLSQRTFVYSSSLTITGEQQVIAPAGQDVVYGVPLKALGGGAAPTFGTIGGSGPTAAAQNSWMRVVDSTGAAFYVPAWK